MDKEAIFEKFAFLREAPELREAIREVAKLVQLKRGAWLFRSGDRCSGVALVGKGNVRVFKAAQSGREITLYHVGPGETCLLTLNGALTGAPYAAEALVDDDVEAVVIPPAVFAEYVDRESTLRRMVFGSMAQRVSELMSLVDEVAFGRLEQRLAEYLLKGFVVAGPVRPTLLTTHESIASELGSAREVISRLLKEFERRGVLRLERGKITLRDEILLRSALERS